MEVLYKQLMDEVVAQREWELLCEFDPFSVAEVSALCAIGSKELDRRD